MEEIPQKSNRKFWSLTSLISLFVFILSNVLIRFFHSDPTRLVISIVSFVSLISSIIFGGIALIRKENKKIALTSFLIALVILIIGVLVVFTLLSML